MNTGRRRRPVTPRSRVSLTAAEFDRIADRVGAAVVDTWRFSPHDTRLRVTPELADKLIAAGVARIAGPDV